MKQKTFVIRNEQVISNLIEFINSVRNERLIEVVVKDHHKDRNLLQNSLYWFWITIIAEEMGLTKEDVHFDLKKRILVRIFERDDEGYAEMIHSIRKLYTKGFKTESIKLHESIVKMTSTTSATVKQFAEYLTEIERDMANKGIILPRKEDQYYDSLMIPKPKNEN